MASELPLFVSLKGFHPFGIDGRRLSGSHVEAYHYGLGDAFHLAVVAVDNALFECEALFSHVSDSGEYGNRFGDICGREEVAVYVGDNYVDMSPVDTFRHHILKIAALAEVEKLDIYRIIEVTEQVDVVEAYLQGHLGAGREIPARALSD